MTAKRRQPWEQLPDEPAKSYARFRLYLSLGAGRSLDKAYLAYQARKEAANGQFPGGTERQQIRDQAPGSWRKDCRRYKWPGRAIQWDISQLQEIGRQTAAVTAEYLKSLALRGLEALANAEGPVTWADHLATAEVLMKFVSPATLAALATEYGNAEK